MPRRINDSSDDNEDVNSEANIDFDNSMRREENAQTHNIAHPSTYKRAK